MTSDRTPGPTAGPAARVTSRVYVPACLVAIGAAGLVAFGWYRGFGGESLAASTVSLRDIVVGPVSLAVIGAILVAERVRPAQRNPLVGAGHRQDLLYTVLNATLVVPAVAALSLAFAHLVRTTMPWLTVPAGGPVPRWAATALIFVAMDGANWAAHLANHRNRLLWRFHELHHSQEEMSVLTVFRTHPLVHVSYLVALLPALVLQAYGALTVTILVAYAAAVAFAHSNTNLGFGPLERIFVSPNYHRIHHRLDGAQDVNLGFALTIWDQLFGRAVFPTEATIRAATGLPGRPLAVEQEAGRGQLTAFAAQLVGPFRPMDHEADLVSSRAVIGRRRRREQRRRQAGQPQATGPTSTTGPTPTTGPAATTDRAAA